MIENLSLQSPLVSGYKIWCCSKSYFTHCFCWVWHTLFTDKNKVKEKCWGWMTIANNAETQVFLFYFHCGLYLSIWLSTVYTRHKLEAGDELKCFICLVNCSIKRRLFCFITKLFTVFSLLLKYILQIIFTKRFFEI